MKLRTILYGAVLAVANVLLPVPAQAAQPAPHPAYCFFAYHPMAAVVAGPPAAAHLC